MRAATLLSITLLTACELYVPPSELPREQAAPSPPAQPGTQAPPPGSVETPSDVERSRFQPRVGPVPSRLSVLERFTVSVSIVDDEGAPTAFEGPVTLTIDGTQHVAPAQGGGATFPDLWFTRGAAGAVITAAIPEGTTHQSAPIDVEERQLVITELSQGTPATQLIEVHNLSQNLLRLDGGALVVDGRIAPIHGGTTSYVPAAGRVIIRRAAFPHASDFKLHEPSGFTITPTSIIRLLDAEGRLQDVLAIPALGGGSTLQLDVDAGADNDELGQWCRSFPLEDSAGVANRSCAAASPGEVMINELAAGFLELKGSPGARVGGLRAEVDDGESATMVPDARLGPTGLLLIERAMFPATGGLVTLWIGALAVDSLAYGALPEGASVARSGPSTVVDTTPTPGQDNGFPPTELTSITPDNAPIQVAQPISILGTGLADVARVFLDGGALECEGDDVRLDCLVPAGAEARRAGVTLVFGSGVTITRREAFTFTRALNETGAELEADYCALVTPQTLVVAPGAVSAVVEGRIFESAMVDLRGVTAELGFGPAGSDPRESPAWRFVAAAWVAQDGADAVFQATVSPADEGQYRYGYRFSLDDGLHWTYCDQDGAGSDPNLDFEPARLGTMTVAAN